MTLLENFVYRAGGGGIIYRKNELKVSVVTVIREAFNWLFCNLNEREARGGGYVNINMKLVHCSDRIIT